MKTFYFMAGLPRSGSTLLSSILNQNPRFYSGPSSPVLGAMYAVEENFTNNGNGQPIVETPQDAINTFKNIDLDYLVIRNYLVTRK